MSSLFDEDPCNAMDAAELAVEQERATRVEQFLNRWEWRGDRSVVRRELVDLIEWTRRRSQQEDL